MYGINYEVTLGIEMFKYCFSLLEVNSAIKSTFPNSSPEEVMPIDLSVEDFWQEVDQSFDYRSDDIGVSLNLSDKQERILKSKQQEIKEFIKQYIKAVMQLYSYPYLEGIPGYPVFWDYTFVLLDCDGDCLLFYGSSSD